MSHHVFENQYKKTKERAEMFASSLYKAREQEELFEEERQQWVHSFEEKSAIIEQLERELTSTVDALDQEKRERTVLQKELNHTTWDNAHNKSTRDPKFNAKNHAEHDDSINSRQNYPVTTRSNPRNDQSDEFEKSGKRVLELLQQSQDETNRAKKDIMSIRLERDQLSEQIVIVRRQYERDSDEKEKLVQSLRLSEGDVALRDRQIAEYQLEREVHRRREVQLLELVESLQKQVALQRNELIKAAGDLETAATHRMTLEDRIEVLNQTAAEQTEQAKIPSLQERFEEMEVIVVELARRAESAENSLSLLIDSGTKQFEVPDGCIMPSESASSHPLRSTSAPSTSKLNSDFNGLAESRRCSNVLVPTRPKVDFKVFPPVGSDGMSSELAGEDVISSDFHRSMNSRQEYTDNLSMIRHNDEYLYPHENISHSTVTDIDNSGMKKSSGARKLVKTNTKSKSTGSKSMVLKEKTCPNTVKGKAKSFSVPRNVVDLTPRTASQSRNVSLGSEYGSYIREAKSTLPNNPVTKCNSSIRREKNKSLGRKSQFVQGYQSPSVSKVRDPSKQKISGVTKNLTGTRNTSTLYYDSGRGDGASTINLATFHPRQPSPYRPSSAASSYISIPLMKSSARGAATTPAVTERERAGRHKLQVTIPSGFAPSPFRV